MTIHVDFQLPIDESEQRVEMTADQEATLTDACHACIRGELTVNGKLLTHITHLYRTESGEWHTRDGYGVSLSIPGEIKDPSPAARSKASEYVPILLSRALSEVEDLEAKRILAHQRHTDHELERAGEAMTMAEEEHAKAKAELTKWQEACKAAHQGDIPSHK